MTPPIAWGYRFDTGTRLPRPARAAEPGRLRLFGFAGRNISSGPCAGEPRLKWASILRAKAALIGVTYFDSTLKDEIYTDFLPPTFDATVLNRTSESTQEGVEIFAEARLSPSWNIDASYTYVDSQENGVEEVRRPPHIASLNVGWRAPDERAGIVLTVRYNGSTNDTNFTLMEPDPFVRLSYTLVNLGADFRLTRSVQLYGRVENLLDERYEEVFTYRSAGRAAYGGVRFSF
jgi:vitamin B12 transporter